jgi:Xaa-Pro aminopeptidase
MVNNSLDAFIIPANDNHFGEYIQSYYKCVEWLSGFDGSAATLVVTLQNAALWTDSRYFVQAEEQLNGSGIELKKLKMAGTESVAEWLQNILIINSKVGVDSDLFSVLEFESLKKQLEPLELVMGEDPFIYIWKEREPIYFNNIIYLKEEYSGESVLSKHKRIVDAIDRPDNFIYLVSVCDDIAWLCNIRGTDVDYNPLPLCYATITRETITLFVNRSSLTAEVSEILKSNEVIIEDYKNFARFISDYPVDSVRIASKGRISIKNFIHSVNSGGGFIADEVRGGVIAATKAVKNDIEIDGFKKAMLLDSVAWVKLGKFIDENLFEGDKIYSEWELAQKMISFRALSKDYLGESFCPIVAFGKNGALPHYEPSEDNCDNIGTDGLLLVDTGGQYSFGTTDSTRVFPLGKLTHEQKRDYTLVLKGMINLSMAKFPKGTRGASLDVLARGPICSAGKLYLHGTGHGIGHHLCVHEGPQSIRMEENPVVLQPGMITSNEPAVYEQGEYGIRIENTILCKEWTETKYGQFYEFDTLNFIPIDTLAIEKKLLGKEALDWLNDYHAKVFAKVSPFLDEGEREWLAVKTAYLN